jgi:DNA invertase Pin-like site-specific DNA recombinase
MESMVEGVEPTPGGEAHRGRYIAYCRVSTQRQGESGLGLAAQREVIDKHLDGGRWKLVATFTEVESGRRVKRPQLAKALAACKKLKATLIVSRLDRLARNTQFLCALLNSNVPIEFCDFEVPKGATGRLILQVMASVAEFESRVIGERTRAALAAARKRPGAKPLGGPNAQSIRNAQAAAERDAKLAPVVAEIRKARPDISANALAHELNERKIATAVKGARWHAESAKRLLQRLERLEGAAPVQDATP